MVEKCTSTGNQHNDELQIFKDSHRKTEMKRDKLAQNAKGSILNNIYNIDPGKGYTPNTEDTPRYLCEH